MKGGREALRRWEKETTRLAEESSLLSLETFSSVGFVRAPFPSSQKNLTLLEGSDEQPLLSDFLAPKKVEIRDRLMTTREKSKRENPFFAIVRSSSNGTCILWSVGVGGHSLLGYHAGREWSKSHF